MKRGRVYNRIYTPELWEQVNKQNKDILNDFMAEYRQRKKSKGTIDGYFQDLRIVFIYILKNLDNRSILELRKKDFRNLSIWLSEDCEMSANRVNRIKSSVNSMLSFVEDDDEYDYDNNVAKKVRGLPRERVKDNDDDFFFTFDEFIKVRDILVERGRLQDAVLLSIGFDSAGRKNELFQIEKHGLTEGNKTNVVIGKRGKKFPLVYLDDTKELIKQYLEERGEDDIPSLWIKGSGDKKSPITKDSLYDRIVSISKIFSEVRGEECNIFPHTMRHSRAECLKQGTDTRLLDENGKPRVYSLDQIMKFMHHSDVSTTASYLMNHDDEEIDAMFGI
jgi:integrase